MKSTQRNNVIKHSTSSDISFPVAVDTKKNLTYVRFQVYMGITKLQANTEQGETFQNRQQGKTVTNLSFRIFSSESFLKTLISSQFKKKVYQ